MLYMNLSVEAAMQPLLDVQSKNKKSGSANPLELPIEQDAIKPLRYILHLEIIFYSPTTVFNFQY